MHQRDEDGRFCVQPPQYCSIDGCELIHKARSWCTKHYWRWKRHGDPLVMASKRSKRPESLGTKIGRNLRVRMWYALNGEKGIGSAVRDLGCSLATFRLYIENQFEEDMTWDNYGEWHLDHVLPLASFDLMDRVQFLEAANWLNYQPLWAKDNLRKSKYVGR